ncbi:MAG: hypothetical protein ACLGPL_03705 [Acidobacteriota bacterium]
MKINFQGKGGAVVPPLPLFLGGAIPPVLIAMNFYYLYGCGML